MTDYERTAYHEAGHATLWLLEEKHLGEPKMISAVPDDRSRGRVVPSDNHHMKTASPEGQRALGRVLSGGFVAERLAGCPLHLEGSSGDIGYLAKVALLSKRGERFSSESMAGAELMLRSHWGAVRGIAELLMQLGTLTAPSGIELARMKLREAPRPIATGSKALLRLLGAIEHVPELADPIRAELGLDLAKRRTANQRAQPKRRTHTRPTQTSTRSTRTYTRSTSAYLKPIRGIEKASGKVPPLPPSRGVVKAN